MPDRADRADLQLSPGRRAVLLSAALALPPAAVLGLVALVAGVLVAVAVLVVVWGLVFVWVRVVAPRRLLATIDGQPADPVRHARLINLVEGLCAGAGLRVPSLLVRDAPGRNAMVGGVDADRALLVVTTGLLAGLNRVELEAVLAEELVQIRRLEMVPTTVCAAMFGWGARLALRPRRDADNDQAAVSLTRYPPGLIAALSRMNAEGTAVQPLGRGQACLWLADPRPSQAAGDGVHLPLTERIGALREL